MAALKSLTRVCGGKVEIEMTFLLFGAKNRKMITATNFLLTFEFYIQTLRNMSLCDLFTLESVHHEPDFSKFAVTTSFGVKFAFTLSGCMHPEDDMETLLQGKDYKYSDCDLTIDQKDGTTTFKLESDNGSAFEVSLPWECCVEPLRKWVYASQNADEDSDDIEDEIAYWDRKNMEMGTYNMSCTEERKLYDYLDEKFDPKPFDQIVREVGNYSFGVNEWGSCQYSWSLAVFHTLEFLKFKFGSKRALSIMGLDISCKVIDSEFVDKKFDVLRGMSGTLWDVSEQIARSHIDIEGKIPKSWNDNSRTGLYCWLLWDSNLVKNMDHTKVFGGFDT